MKLKRLFALLGAVLLAGLFVLAIVLAAIGAPKNYLMAVIFSIVFIPIILFAMGLMKRVLKPTQYPDLPEEGGLAHDGAAHDGAAHDGAAYDRAAHDGTAHDGAEYDRAAQNGAAYDRKTDHGAKHPEAKK